MGDAWRELEVMEDALIAEVGMEGLEDMEGRKPVCTWLGLARLVVEEDRDEEERFMGVEVGWGSIVAAVALSDGLEEFEVIVI